MAKRRLLWVGDAGVPSGFARCTHYILDTLKDWFDVGVIALNYRGDPHGFPYPMWPAWVPGGDYFGISRLPQIVTDFGPAVMIVQQDPWNVQDYLAEVTDIPVIGAIAVDSENCRGTQLNGLAHAIFWTKFGEEQARLGGYTGPSTVIPLGVDTKIYFARDKKQTREQSGLTRALADRGLPEDAFIVGVVGRNQVRKRMDLTIEYFAAWVHKYEVHNAGLWLHVAPTGDDAFDLSSLGTFFGVHDRLLFPTVRLGQGVREETLAKAYSMFDAFFSTSQGEGWNLPAMEAMACGCPCILPNASATAEWPDDAALLMDTSGYGCHPPRQISSMGRVVDKNSAVEALQKMYTDPTLRQHCTFRGLTVVNQQQYRWKSIGEAYVRTVNSVLGQMAVPPQEEKLVV